MIITRYLIKDLGATLAGVLFVLFLMAISAQLVGLFSKVAAGTIQAGTVANLFGLYLLKLVPMILPLSLYLAVLLSLTRFYRDSEMAALAACGFGPFQVMKSVIIVSLLFAILQAGFTLFFAPWADAQGKRLEAISSKTVDIQGITPGRFRTLPKGQGVIYVEAIEDDGSKVTNIFLNATLNNQNTLVVAKTGHIEIDEKNGDRFLVLMNGYRYEGYPGQDEFTIVQFDKHAIRIETQGNVKVSYRHRSIPTHELIKRTHITYKAEFQWRISQAVLCIALAILAVPLSRTSHRQGRYSKLAIAIVLYLVVTNLLNMGRDLLVEKVVPMQVGLWWIHGVIILFAVALIYYQIGFKHLFTRNRGR